VSVSLLTIRRLKAGLVLRARITTNSNMASEEAPKTTTLTSSGSDVERASPPQTHIPSDDDGLEDNSNVPKLSLLKIFWLFFWHFGCFAWGGPVAQIALIKERLVLKEKWITLARFQRVFSVYQILPGPEAAELCMFFGCLSAGRYDSYKPLCRVY